MPPPGLRHLAARNGHAERSAALGLKQRRLIEANAAGIGRTGGARQADPGAGADGSGRSGSAWTRAAAALEIPVEVIEAREGKRIELHASRWAWWGPSRRGTGR